MVESEIKDYANNKGFTESVLVEDELKSSANVTFPKSFKTDIKWFNVLMFVILHTGAVYGLLLVVTAKAKWQTSLFAVFLHAFGGILGITAGAHRLWSHRAYKARLTLRIFLMLANCIAIENDIYTWCRDHRVHHKFTETDADPHNAHRGFFFSHVGWLLMKKHPLVIEKGKTVDCSDLLLDPVVRFQRRHYPVLALFFCFVLPTMVPALIWDEDYWTAFFVSGLMRYILTLNSTWLVNSAAHAFGNKPYDRRIRAVQSPLVAHLAGGEGWHNYHHCFPQDYRTSEFGLSEYNPTTKFIDFCAYLGQAYDRKSTGKTVASDRAGRTGDGSHPSVKKFCDLK